MKIDIIYDNRAAEGFNGGWGFSCLLDESILFDTGEAPEPLFHNMERLGIDSGRIEAVVISHEHWDHTGGLEGILEKNPGIPVYICPGFSDEFKDVIADCGGRPEEAAAPLEIEDSIFVTGEIPGEYKGSIIPEQALVVKAEKGLTVITGCSHPGIVTIIDRANKMVPKEVVSAVLGGFHLANKNTKTIESIVNKLQDMGVKIAGPCHCTGEAAQGIFKRGFGENFLSLKAGSTVTGL